MYLSNNHILKKNNRNIVIMAAFAVERLTVCGAMITVAYD
jgi:hypothetical protein